MDPSTKSVLAERGRRLLYVLLALTVLLLGVDRAAAYLHVPGPDSRDVVLYATDWCPYCRAIRVHLTINEVPFREHDVEKSIAGMMGFWALRGRGVPITVVGPQVIYGFRLEELDAALERLGYSVSLLPENRG
jgi:mycoredoxin